MNLASRAKISYILSHGLFWCTYCISWSYTACFLTSKGYNSFTVGLVTGLGAITSVILQPVTAALAGKIPFLNDKRNAIILKIISLVTAVLIMAGFPGSLSIAVLFTVLTAIDASIPSILSTLATSYINSGRYLNYGAARGCGSLTYSLFSLALGIMVSHAGTDILMILYIFFGALCILAIAAFPANVSETDNNSVSDNPVNPSGSRERTGFLARYPYLYSFFAASILLYIGHNIYNMFLINIVNRAGGDSVNLGTALAISACVELPVMAYFVRLENKIPVEKLMIISSIIFTLKAFSAIFATSVPAVYVVSFMQIGAFAIFTPGSVYFICKHLSPSDNSLGQALLGSCTLGLGGTLGNILGGFIIDRTGITAALVVAAILSAFGAILIAASMKTCMQPHKTT